MEISAALAVGKRKIFQTEIQCLLLRAVKSDCFLTKTVSFLLTLNQPRTHLCVRGLHKSIRIYMWV